MIEAFDLAPRGIEVAFLWADPDIVEVHIEAVGDGFAAAVDVYASRDQLLRAADAIQGFPSSNSDHRTIEIGTLNAQQGGGGVRIGFQCKDRAGHVVANARFRAQNRHSATREIATAAFPIPLVAGQIDRFVGQLRSVLASAARFVNS